MSDSLRGKFLIAVPKMKDANFFKSVVLMVEHGPDGAMGLVVNHPSSTTVARALKGHFDLPENNDYVYTGGPVEPAALFMIHDSQELDPTENPVVDGLFMGSSAAIFEEVIRSTIDEKRDIRFRIFSGCSGWGPNQLEGEMERGDWLTVDAQSALIFAPDAYSVWDSAYQSAQAAHRLLDLDCQHPDWN
ncbi:MAG: YqgE/AlgH family protein [Planctomycetaceae bacterium]|nr:YqgE/AlgH family protein [Planctomycetaceae bacterium]MCA9029380.1 YqgE/AlgH family protein [Planctomycetaceae bacterium]MCA9043469.1 YqgE/AlgH family protein [Planctomycetaceae bacterium]MCB9950897.1 YqgE/AlgH family protein [Planctomycetaceae bacterium]